MESFNYIESALLFSLKNANEFEKFKFKSDDFAVQGKTFDFLINYIDSFDAFPANSLLVEKFPELDSKAIGVDFDYVLQEFEKQVLYRKAVTAIKDNQKLLKEDPKAAIGKILSRLDDLGATASDDVRWYDSGQLSRLEKYQERVKLRGSGIRILGVPTPFRSVNKTGIGWLPGNLISFFARPTVGKTWICVKSAAVAMEAGYKTLFISAEMTAEEIALRLDVTLGNMRGYNFSHSALRRGDMVNEDSYREFLEKSSARKLLVCDHIGSEMLSLPAIQMLLRKHHPDFLIIDGIYLVSAERSKAVWEKMHSLFNGLKAMCQMTKIPCFVTTQASRNAANMFSPPKANDVAFGDAALQASDMCFSMSLVENEEKMRLIQIQKYRDGNPPVNYMMFNWDVDNGEIREIQKDSPGTGNTTS